MDKEADVARSELPDPTPSAPTVIGIVRAVAEDIPWIGAGFKYLLQNRLQNARLVILEAIKDNGIGELENLSETQRELFLPAAYRFFDQARLGEYEHNLRVLAALIAGELRVTDRPPDVGRVARTARRLDMMTLETLQALARCQRAFEIYENSDEYK